MLEPGFFIDVLMVVCNGHPLDCAYYLFSFQGLRFRSGGNGVLHGDSDVSQSKCRIYLAFCCFRIYRKYCINVDMHLLRVFLLAVGV